MDRPTPRLTIAALALVASACVTQQSPDRSPLPDVEAAVTPPQPCSVVVGESTGVDVETVLAGSPSEGVLAAGDTLVDVDGSPIGVLSDVRDALADRSPGDAVEVTVSRSGDELGGTVVLGAAPDGTTPRLGITITETYVEIPVGDHEGTPTPSELGRLVQVGDRLLGVDPLTANVGVLDIELPDTEFWQMVGGVAYWVEAPSSDDPTLRGSDGSIVQAWDEGVEPARLLGTIDGDLVGVFLDPTGVSVRRFDPGAAEAEWVSRPNNEIGLPVVSYASPDGEMLLLGLGTVESSELRFLLFDADTGAIRAEIEGLAGNSVFGWFDTTVVINQSGAGELVRTDLTDGSIEPIDLPPFATDDVRLWPVGDGVHLLVDTGSQLLRIDTGDLAATRPLVSRCEIGAVGQPGSGS